MSLNLTSEQIITIRESVKNNTKTKGQLAKEFNIGERSIRNILTGRHYNNVEGAVPSKYANGNTLNEETRQKVVECYNRVLSIYQVEKELKVSRSTVSRILNERRVKLIGRSKPRIPKPYIPPPISDKKLQTIHRLRKAGWTVREIAQNMDLREKDVKCYL